MKYTIKGVHFMELESREMFERISQELKRNSNKPLKVDYIEWVEGLWKTSGKWPFGFSISKVLPRLIREPRISGISRFLESCIPLNPEELQDMTKIFLCLSISKKGEFLKKYRFFLKRKKNMGFVKWETLKDLNSVWFCPRRGLFFGFNKARWRKVAGIMARPIARDFPGSENKICRMEYWDGFSHVTARWLEGLINMLVDEVLYVRDFSIEVSKRSNKVVLNWHNATLGAAGGWGFSGPVFIPQHAEEMKLLKKEVLKLWSFYQRTFENDGYFRRLWNLFYERLVLPKMEFMKFIQHELVELGRGKEDKDEQYFPYAFPPDASFWQNLQLPEVIAWGNNVKSYWIEGWSLLWALIKVGSSAIKSEIALGVVLPRIDKFFISTRRTQDTEYLALLIERLLNDFGNEIIILLWDDTFHDRQPSLYLAISQFLAKKYPIKGLGIYEHGIISKNPSPDDIINLNEKFSIFVLRPFESKGAGFEKIFRERSFAFFRSYSPSWKDGLSFVYAGTEVFPFVSVQTLLEAYAPWVLASGKRILVGNYILQRIQIEATRTKNYKLFSDEITSIYNAWASLE